MSGEGHQGSSLRSGALLTLLVSAVAAIAAAVVPQVAGGHWPIVAVAEAIDQRSTLLHDDRASFLPLPQDGWMLQPWIPALLMRAVWIAGGATGLSVLSIGLAVVTVCCVMAAGRRAAAPLPAALAVLWMLPLVQPMTLRTEAFAVALAAALILLLSTRVWWAAPILVALWANVHGSFPVGVCLVGAACTGMLPVARRIMRDTSPKARAAVICASAGAVLINPRGYAVIGYIRDVQGTSLLEQLTPLWRSLGLADWQLWYVVGSCLALLLYGVRRSPAPGDTSAEPDRPHDGERASASSFDKPSRWILPRWTVVLPLLALAAASIHAQRYLVWFALVGVLHVASALGATWRRREWPSTVRSRAVGTSLIAVVAALCVLVVPGGALQSRLATGGFPQPSKLEVMGLDHRSRVLASLEWASWVHLYTGARTHADARLERFRHRDLAWYLDVTAGRKSAVDSLLQCRGGRARVDAAVLRRRTAAGLIATLDDLSRTRHDHAGTARVERQWATRRGSAYRLTCTGETR